MACPKISKVVLPASASKMTRRQVRVVLEGRKNGFVKDSGEDKMDGCQILGNRSDSRRV